MTRRCGLVLFACAGLLLSFGVILGGSTAWSLIRISYYFWTTDLHIELGSSLLIIMAAALCMPICWVATIVPYHPNKFSIPATLMCLVIAALALMCAGLTSSAALARSLRDPGLNRSMHEAMRRDPHDQSVRTAFSAMQLELQCCGVQSYEDWYGHRQTLPASCCGKVPVKHGDGCETPLYTSGCLRPAAVELRYFTDSCAVLGLSIIIVLTVTLLATAYLVVDSVVEPGCPNLLKGSHAVRVACLSPSVQYVSLPSPVPMPLPARAQPMSAPSL
ncbi:hypothetical protein JYU34_009521 [Plutella xylostella]|uniref:Tetraspanin n=1 Tax=Plutella xylostella TaxID=51655 RepID=A0ABQ7QMV6_PLUXY|nr:hypothetical protein JYU34_009521 [Plutella xylostella]